MPTKKRRIGFIPSINVLEIIIDISKEDKLSNSKVVNILIEEALYARGLIKTKNKLNNEKPFKGFIDELNEFKDIFKEYELKFGKDEQKNIQTKPNTEMYKRFVQFVHFTQMMNVLENIKI